MYIIMESEFFNDYNTVNQKIINMNQNLSIIVVYLENFGEHQFVEKIDLRLESACTTLEIK